MPATVTQLHPLPVKAAPYPMTLACFKENRVPDTWVWAVLATRIAARS